ncbi:MAG: nitrate reductase cytochrome c-type subunit [Pseudomonadota bacterium]
MKTIYLLGISTLALVAISCVSAGGGAIEDSSLGLDKTSVFETPSPEPFNYSTSPPGSGEALPLAYAGAPPQIPHSIDAFLPVTAESNQCMACHDKPDLIGQQTKGVPTPMPRSHYTDLRRAPEKVTKKMIGSRFVCTQCHTPQADVAPLVENTSGSSGK